MMKRLDSRFHRNDSERVNTKLKGVFQQPDKTCPRILIYLLNGMLLSQMTVRRHSWISIKEISYYKQVNILIIFIWFNAEQRHP